MEKLPRKDCRRSETVLMVKNIPYSTKLKEIQSIFERYGALKRVEMSPFNTLALVEYESASQAKTAAKNLAYYKVNYIMPIYLEFAPEAVIHEGPIEQSESSDDEEQPVGEEDARFKTVFVKNLNFNTTEAQLEQAFNAAKLKGKLVSVKIVRRSDN